MAVLHYRSRIYQDPSGNMVSDRYTFYEATEAKNIILDDDYSLDEISLRYYQTPLYYWLIGEANNISNPFEKVKKGTSIKVPVI